MTETQESSKMPGAAITVEDLHIYFDQLHVIDGISLSAPAGQFVAVIGPSGCGKSTLLNALAGFVTPSRGTVLIDELTPTSPKIRRGMVFQEYALFPWRTALKNVEFALEASGFPAAGRGARARELLQLVHLESAADRYPHQLSGGMKQRVAIARALASEPSLLLMDEPLGALDALTRESLMELIDDVWRRTRQTVVYITHNVAEAIFLGDRVVVFSDGPQATIKADIEVALPRPRDRFSREAIDYQKYVTELLH